MEALCPHCGKSGDQGSNYPKLLALATARKLMFLCGNCDVVWKPTTQEQKRFVVKLKSLLAKRVP
jgi:hypothetical protein